MRGSVVVMVSVVVPTVEMGSAVLVMEVELGWVGTRLMVTAGTRAASSAVVASMVRVEAGVDLLRVVL